MGHIKNLKTIGQVSRGESLFLPVAVFAFLLTLPFSIGDMIVGSSELNPATDPSTILNRYGEVIYRYNEKSPRQLFVIGMSHRDSLTRRNGSQTSRVQGEVCKIGEWLIHHRGLELLLPEGYFAGKGGTVKAENVIGAIEKNRGCPVPFDMDTLEEILSDNRTFINAEILLRKNYPSLQLRQVEDRALYETARKRITELIDQKNSCDYLLLRSELDYLQERRTAAILQRIPEIVNEEFQKGNIKSRKAILTVGIFHVHKIIRYLNDRRITVYAPLGKSGRGEDYTAELSLAKENFGVTIILPRTLADDEKILRINRLDEIVKQRTGVSLLSSAVLP